jgi:flagellar protein FlgJ
MTAPTNVSFYADPQGLASLRNEAKAQDPRALKEVAKQFESLFTQMLMKSMRESNKALSNGDSLFGSDQADFYQDMFDQQMAVHLSQGQGLGLADMLVRQLSQTAPARLEAGGRGSEIGNSNAAASSGLQPPASRRQPVAMSREDFIRQMLPHAEKAARQLGVDPQALVAQAALETGWGKSMPCNVDGTCSYNMFGIKAGSSWSGATARVPTLEFEDGVAVRKVDSFRAYASPAESFADYARLIRNNPRYRDALNAGPDVSGFAAALQEGGYATDPDYARKITAVARELKALIGADQIKSADGAPISEYPGVRS